MTEAPGEGIASRIREARATIYSGCDPDSDQYYPIRVLEARLQHFLVNRQWDAPPKTRAKLGKIAVAEALGYLEPPSFRKTRPRFPHQNLDSFFMQSGNLQIWNEEIDPERRYAIVRLDQRNVATAVRVVTGESVALWDRTGTLTTKFQAARKDGRNGSCLVSAVDTQSFRSLLAPAVPTDEELMLQRAFDAPLLGTVLPIAEIHQRLLSLVGTRFTDPGLTNDRGRGAAGREERTGDRFGLGRERSRLG